MQNIFLVALCIVAANATSICDKTQCRDVTNCKGRIIRRWYTCCNVCLDILLVGERCKPYAFTKYSAIPVNIHSVCRTDLRCSKVTRTCVSGEYDAPVMCNGYVCKCIASDGDQISGYGGRVGSGMNCRCARDMDDHSRILNKPRLFRCEPNGNYKNVQCMGNACFCVDKFGNWIGRKVIPFSQVDSFDCSI